MLNLFTLDSDFNLVALPEAFGLKTVKAVMKKYRNKSHGLAELLYVYYMVDYRSDLLNIIDEQERSEAALQTIQYGDKIKIDKTTEDFKKFYEESQPSISFRHLETMKVLLHNLQKAALDIDMTKIYYDAEGNVVEAYDTLAMNRVYDSIIKSPKLIQSIKEMEKQVKTEMQESSNTRGSGEKSIYEDD